VNRKRTFGGVLIRGLPMSNGVAFTDPSGQIVGYPEATHLAEKSLALIGNASAVKGRIGAEIAAAEAFSIRRLGGSRWRLRRTRPMGIGCRFGTGFGHWAASCLQNSWASGKEFLMWSAELWRPGMINRYWSGGRTHTGGGVLRARRWISIGSGAKRNQSNCTGIVL
jgi:hypothetical protein